MANYNLVVNTSSFKPYDILGMYLPILTAEKNQYDKNVESLDKIAIENGLYIPPDGKYKDMKDLYTADLMDIASKVSNGELSTRAVNDIRRRYYKDIVPIDKAAEAYNKYLDKLTALGPDAIIGNRSTFDDFYGGKNQAIDYRSAKLVELDSMKYFSGINNALTQDPTFRSILNKQYYLQTQKGGLDSGAALQAALVEYNNRTNGQHSEAVLNLLGHMLNVMSAEAVDNFSEDAKKQVWNKVASGLVASIQAPKYSQVTNRDYETSGDKRQMAYQEALMAKSGYIYNPSTGKYEYDEEAAATAGRAADVATLPDGSTWNYDPKKKLWTSPDATWDGVPRTSAQLIQERNRLIAAQNKKSTTGEFVRDNKGQLSPSAYLSIGNRFDPIEFRIEDITGSEAEQQIDDASGFSTLSLGGNNYYKSRWYGSNTHKSLEEIDLPGTTKLAILEEARKLVPELELADLELYIDTDWFSKDHARVVIKGTGESGNYLGTTRANAPAATGGTTVRNDSTTVASGPKGLM